MKYNAALANIPETREGCLAEMADLENSLRKVKRDIAQEKAALLGNRGAEWLAKAEMARRIMGQRRMVLQNEAARLRRQEKLENHIERAETWERTFMKVAKEFLDAEEYTSIVNETRRRCYPKTDQRSNYVAVQMQTSCTQVVCREAAHDYPSRCRFQQRNVPFPVFLRGVGRPHPWGIDQAGTGLVTGGSMSKRSRFNWDSFGGGVIITLAVAGALYLVLKVVFP